MAISGYGSIRGLEGKCIDAKGGQVHNEDGSPANLILFPCNGEPNQKWDLRSDGSIQGLEGKCIDTKGGQVQNEDGSPVELILFSCNGEPNQRWRLR